MLVMSTSTIEVSIRADRGDGNDPYEETARLALAPSIGDTLEVWIDNGVNMSHSVYLEVKDIVFCTYCPERIEVWVSTDGITDEDLERTFKAIRDNDQP
jgi:hypothetical protein